MAVSKRTRYEVLRRDNHTCRYCGGRAPDVVLTVDHVIPVALGGSDAPDNLVAACVDCNAGKSSASPDSALVEQVNQDALRFRGAMRLALADTEVAIERRTRFRQEFHQEWHCWTYGWKKQTYPLPAAWEGSVDRWYTAGLSRVILWEAIRLAMQGPAGADDKFRYLAGVVKRQLAQITAAAVESAAEPIEPLEAQRPKPSAEWNDGYKTGWEVAERRERYWRVDIWQLDLRAAVLDPRAAS